MRITAITTIGLIATMIATHAAAQDSLRVKGAEVFPQMTVGLFLGGVTETERTIPSETSFALGAEVEYRWRREWGVSGVVEYATRSHVVRNVVVVATAEWHFWREAGLMFGPGIEFAENENAALLRVGLNWESSLIEPFKIIPEFAIDFVEGGAISYVYGVLLATTF